MQIGDVKTITIKRSPSGSFLKILEKEWLEYLGYSQKEIDGDEIAVVFKAEISDRRKIPFIGLGRPVEQVKK
jgi:hypothetical protein